MSDELAACAKKQKELTAFLEWTIHQLCRMDTNREWYSSWLLVVQGIEHMIETRIVHFVQPHDPGNVFARHIEIYPHDVPPTLGEEHQTTEEYLKTWYHAVNWIRQKIQWFVTREWSLNNHIKTRLYERLASILGVLGELQQQENPDIAAILFDTSAFPKSTYTVTLVSKRVLK